MLCCSSFPWMCRKRVLCFNPQVLNSCGHHYGPIFPGDVFPSTEESENRIFLLLVLFLLPALEFCKHQGTLCLLLLWSVCCGKPSLQRPCFTYNLQHVSELLLPLTQRGMWAAKRQSHDAYAVCGFCILQLPKDIFYGHKCLYWSHR